MLNIAAILRINIAARQSSSLPSHEAYYETGNCFVEVCRNLPESYTGAPFPMTFKRMLAISLESILRL